MEGILKIQLYIRNICLQTIQKTILVRTVYFLILKKENIDSLTQREYEYFMLKQKECDNFNSKNIENTPQERIANQYESNSAIWVFFVILSIAGTVLLYVTSKK